MELKPILKVKPACYKGFDCGVEELNTYLRRFAKKNDKLNVGRTYLLLDEGVTVGFYTASMGSMEFQSLPPKHSTKLPRYPLPVFRICRLAVDKKFRQKGFGKFILMEALLNAWSVASKVAIYAVVVDAKDENAKKFYQHYGFMPYQDMELSLFLPLGCLEELFE